LGAHTAKGDDWARDARVTLPLLAQQAAERGDALLSGDLWTLTRKALGTGTGDDRVSTLLTALPAWLRGVPKLDALRNRSIASLRVATSSLPCTSPLTDLKRWRRVGCQRYPLALGLRVAEGLPRLPILVRHAERHDTTPGHCRAWRTLHDFLTQLQEGSYDPDGFVAAIEALRRAGRIDDAAVLLTRHRRQRHCSPVITAHARSLGRMRWLGPHLRADALSVALNCGGMDNAPAVLDDLDSITSKFSSLNRNLQVVLFAARLAVARDNFAPLASLTGKQGFYERYATRGPQLATAALLLRETAQAVAAKVPSWAADAYRLLCTTLPSVQRGASCRAIAQLRATTEMGKRQRLAKRALSGLLDRLLKPNH
jgi:hypothetical protein